MTLEPKYPLEKAMFAPNDKAMAESWLHSLEITGPENVRARLAQNAGHAPGAAIPIGMVQHMTIGFAEHWLAWHDRQKSERENTFRARQIFWTRLAAIAAATAAMPAFLAGSGLWQRRTNVWPGMGPSTFERIGFASALGLNSVREVEQMI